MLDLQEGESIHSLIYRVHYIYGILDVSNIITQKGLWRAFPYLSASSQRLYESVDDTKLLASLQDIEIAWFSFSKFSNPFRYYFELKKFLNEEHCGSRSQRSGFSIKFCPLCINDSIKRFGYGYFKSLWIYQASCEVHKSPLLIIEDDSYSKSLIAIESILKGEDVNCRPCTRDDIANKNASNCYLCRYQDLNESPYAIAYAPCLIDRIRHLVAERYFLAKDMKSKEYYFEYELNRSSEIFGYFNEVRKEFAQEVEDFWSESVSEVAFYVGIRTYRQLLYKNRFSNCQECTFTECPLSTNAIDIRTIDMKQELKWFFEY